MSTRPQFQQSIDEKHHSSVDYDIIIVGGGMVGASMACSLADTDYKIAIVEAFKSNSDQQPSFDERTVALTYSSKLIFNAIDVWQDVASEAYPIKNIEVTNKDSFGFSTLGTNDIQTEALGYVVPTRRIGQVLHQRINNLENIDLICPATVESIENESDYAQLTIKQENETQTLHTKLVILADGGRSGLLEQLGFTAKTKTYPQSALIGIIGTDTAHDGKAYEHFTEDGPLALLPIRKQDYALAWTLKEQSAKNLYSNAEDKFLETLQVEFGKRAGNFKTIASRNVYPLSHSVLTRPFIDRTVIIGNAAHIVHPVAGQGFNLGLRDVGFLHDILTSTSNTDPGSENHLSNYSELRKHDTQVVGQFTDGLIRTFTSDFFPIKAGRNIGLSVINLLPSVKKGLLKRTMGIHGKQSKLAMSGKEL